jgi:hypothetical protein
VSRKRLYLVLGVACLLIVSATYGVTRFLYVVDRKMLGVRRGSVSEMESRDGGFYVGTYVPAKRLVALNDLSVVHIPDAWVEHAWKPELSFLLRDIKTTADGYYLYLPIPADESAGFRRPIWEFPFALEVQPKGPSGPSPGMGFDSGLGFMALMDSLPDTLTVALKQKQREEDSWNDAVITETIEFKRAF